MKPRVLSPTAVSKYRLCRRLYAFEYNEGFRPPPSKKQAFGLEVHKKLELWLKKGVYPDDSPAGLTARQGIDKGWLPKPDSSLLIEEPFVIPIRRGLSAGGFIDCVAPPGLTGDDPLVVDHKSTSDLRWAKTTEQLFSDSQVLLYGLWAMLKWKMATARARWVYYAASNPTDDQPRRPRGAKPVEVQLSNQLPVVVEAIEKLLHDLDVMEDIRAKNQGGLTFPPSPESCGAFGGCPHVERCNLSSGDRLAAYIEKAY